MDNNYEFHAKKIILSRIANSIAKTKKTLGITIEQIIRRFTKTREQELIRLTNENALLLEKIAFDEEVNAVLTPKSNILREISSKMMVAAQKDSWERVSLSEVAGMLNWPELLIAEERTNGFSELVRLMSLFSTQESLVSNPSAAGTLATKNCDQLLADGYTTFKRTIGPIISIF